MFDSKKISARIAAFLVCALLLPLVAAPIAGEAAEPTLIFKSGYGPNTDPDPADAIRFLRGTDLDTGFNWVTDLQQSPGMGSYDIQYTGGTNAQRWARIIQEPGNPGNHVMWFYILHPNADNGNGRVQSNLYGNSNLREFTIRNRIYLHPDLQHLINDPAAWSFFTLFEFWNNPNWTGNPYPFRIALNLRKLQGAGQPLYFDVKGEIDTIPGSSNWQQQWRTHFTGFEVPLGTWLDTELYLKEGDNETGRFYFALTPEGGDEVVIFDLAVPTQHPNDPAPTGFTHINPQKLYTAPARVNTVRNAGGAVQMYWDDFELWTFGADTVPVDAPYLRGTEDFEASLSDPNDLSPLGATFFTHPQTSGLTVVDGSATIGSGKVLDFRSSTEALTGVEWNFVDSVTANMKAGKVSFDFYLPDAAFGTNHQLEFGMREFVPGQEAAVREVGDRLVRLRFDQKPVANLGGHRLRTGNVAEVAAIFQPKVKYHLEMIFNAHHADTLEYASPAGGVMMLNPLATVVYLDGEFKGFGGFVSSTGTIASDDPAFGLGRLGFWSHNDDPARSVHFQIDNLAVTRHVAPGSDPDPIPLPTDWLLVNFDPPAYAPGPLHEQGEPVAWGGGPAGGDTIRVESGVGVGGSQGLQVLGPRWLDYTLRPSAESLGGSNAATGVYTFGTSIRLLDQPHPNNNFEMMRLYMTNGDSGPAVWLSAMGRLRMTNGGTNYHWMEQGETIYLTAVLDFDSGTYSAYIDGEPLFTGAAFNKGADYGNIHLKVSGGYDAAIHKNYVFDDIFVRPGAHPGFNPATDLDPDPDPAMWAGFPLWEGNFVDTGDWLGFLFITEHGWVHAFQLGSWIFLPEEHVEETGAWIYVPRP